MALQSVLSFDGKSNFIEVPYSQTLNPEQFTVSAWVKMEAGQGYQGIISSLNYYFIQGYVLSITPNYSWELYLGLHGKANSINMSNVVLNTWSNVAVTCDNSNQKLYVNGQFMSQATYSYSPNKGVSSLRIGASGGSMVYHLYCGKIAEVCIWNKVRTEDEIKRNINHRLIGNEPGLVAYWPLNEGKGDKIFDKTGNRNHGQICGVENWQSDDLNLADTSKSVAIKNLATGLMLDLYNTKVWLNTKNDNLTQKWTVTSEGIIKNQSGNFALDLKDILDDPRYKNVVINPISGNPSQQGQITPNGAIINKFHGWGLVQYGEGVVVHSIDWAKPEPNEKWELIDL